jgi:hypothetical protein
MTKVRFSQIDKVNQDAFEVDKEGRLYLDLKKLDSNVTKINIVDKTDFIHIFSTSDGMIKTLYIIAFNELHFP